METKIVTLAVDGAWRPTGNASDTTADFVAVRSVATVKMASGNTMHGPWCDDDYTTGNDKARVFAASCPRMLDVDGRPVSAQAIPSTPYWYVHGFGVVEAND